MDRLTLGQARPTLARALNVCTTDSLIPDYANQAHRRLVAKGKFCGTVARYQICTSTNGCLVWPRQIETIESYWLCDTPGTVRNGWYEASRQGPGLMTGTRGYCGSTLVDRGTTATFDNIDGIVSKVMVQSDFTEADDARILIRGYNDIVGWVTSIEDGVRIDGEWVPISTTPHYTVNLFTNITETIKDVTNAPVRLWQYDTTLATAVKELAYYEADETLPIYRASLIPNLENIHGGCASCNGNSTDTCTANQLTVIAKLRHIDVVKDNDFFLIGNLGALKLMVMSVLKEDRNLRDEARAYEADALAELQRELSSYEGDGALPTIRYEGSATWGGAVLNPITLGWPITY